ncbi:hypothetical protein [Streptomyces regalis]|uniref:Uncharacterized protein n=1 Tax=Streptomyces regalis TaxID=68262 RepID=A0A124G794_9ACTN|nr:hypothetical protein [Streptomyces regalis]KUL21987.1 hypothetical protein ADL12_43595 [Streptomyces regalis]
MGAGARIGTDETTGTFTATSPTVPGHTVHATALIEAARALLRALDSEASISESEIAESII